MRRTSLFLVCALTLALAPAAAVVAAQEVFTNEHVKYTLELPNVTWKVSTRPDAAHEHAEFVYGDRLDGYLRIRREVVEAGEKAEDLATRDQDMKFRYQNGYVAGRKERFAGRLSGAVTSYEYTQAGKPMVGIVYYLQADPRTVYTLHFTGRRDKLLPIRSQTDSIARSFQLK